MAIRILPRPVAHRFSFESQCKYKVLYFINQIISDFFANFFHRPLGGPPGMVSACGRAAAAAMYTAMAQPVAQSDPPAFEGDHFT